MLAVRWPPRANEPEAAAIATDNRAALVIAAGAGRGRALLTADADSVVEDSLHIVGPLAVLKVGHHGSGSSSGAAWLARVQPALAVISCGRHNPFGHPDPGALARLAASGAVIRRTDREGTVWLELDDSDARALDWRGGEPARESRAADDARAAARRAPRALAAHAPVRD